MYSELNLHNTITEVEKLAPWCEQIGEENSLGMPEIFQLNLALEEAVSNVINYAYPEQEGMPISLTMSSEDNTLVFTLTDEGIPFNPLESKEPDLSLSAEERPIGGLGIFLVKQLMEKVEYKRAEGKNILTMTYNAPKA